MRPADGNRHSAVGRWARDRRLSPSATEPKKDVEDISPSLSLARFFVSWFLVPFNPVYATANPSTTSEHRCSAAEKESKVAHTGNEAQILMKAISPN